MKGSSEILKYFNESITDFLKQQRDNTFNISAKLRDVVQSVAVQYNQILNYKLDFFNFEVLETSCHLGMPNEREDISCLLALNHAFGVNVFFHTANIRANGAGYSRGIIYQGVKYPFLKNDYEQNGVCFAKPLQMSDIDRISKKIPKELVEILFEPYQDLLNLSSYQDQIVCINNRLFSRVFGVKILTLPLERITKRLILENFKNEGLFYRIIKDPYLRKLVFEEFLGVQGCWSRHSKGTFLFFAKNSKNDLISLSLLNNKLIGRERTIEIPFELEPIIDGLTSDQITPSTFTNLSLLLLEGAQLFGGYFQIDYLAQFISGLNCFGENLDFRQNCFGSGFVINPLTLDNILQLKNLCYKEFFDTTSLLSGLLNNIENLQKLTPDSAIVKEAMLFLKEGLGNIKL